MSIKSTGTRARLLGSVCLSVVATTMATSAMAADTVVSFNLGSPLSATAEANASATAMVGSDGTNTANITATVENGTYFVENSGNASLTTFPVNGNDITAMARGNLAENDIDLTVVENDLEDGAASANAQLNTGVITSAAKTSTISVDIDGFESGSVTNRDNTIAATTFGNTGSTLIAGEIPNNYASTEPGTTSVDSSTLGATASGGIVATSAQLNTVTGHQAEVEGNDITLDLTAPISNTVTAGPTLENNTIAATLRGNNAQSTVDLSGGTNPTFEGSAVLSNLQLNTGSSGIFSEASNTNSTIAAEVSTDNVVAVNTLNGGLSVSGNAITSRIAGNSALDNADGPIGNRIIVGDALSVEGAQPTGESRITLDSGTVQADTSATLAIMNTQGNVGSSDGHGFVATTDDASIQASVNSLEEGTIDLSSNEIGARASGNAATSAIQSGTAGARFEASATIANNQTNLATDVEATTRDVEIAADSGSAGGLTTGSQISVNSNSVTAVAIGNEAGQSLSLNATTLALASGVSVLRGSNSPDGNVLATGAATVASLQSNYSSDVAATLSGSTISLEADSQGAVGASTIPGDALELTGNAQIVEAAGNSGNNDLSLEGNEVGGASGLASVQINEGSNVTSELDNVAARISAQTDVDGNTIDLSGNTIQAGAFGGSATNTVSVDGTFAEDLISDAAVGSSAGSGTVTSNYGLFNNQRGENSNVSATADVSAGGFNVDVAGDLQNVTSSNNANSLVGFAFGNSATNTTDIDIGTITTDDTAGNSQVANALNMQSATGDVASRATGDAVVQTSIDGAVTGSSVLTSDNLIRARATGNNATTRTTVDATSLSTSQLANADSTIETDAAFSVENSQVSDGTVSASQLDDAVTATQSANILTTIEGNGSAGISGSSVFSDTNTSETLATANNANNSLTLAANSAATSSAVKNVQTSIGVVTAQMGIAGTPPSPGTNYVLGGNGGSPDAIGFLGTDVTVGAGDSLAILFDETATGGTELAALLNSLGPNVNISGGLAILGEGSYDFSDFDAFSGNYTVGSGSTVTFSGFSTGGSTGVAPAGGVTIAASGPSVFDSTLSVEGNISRGAVTGNSANNALSVEATSITGDLGGVDTAAEATHVLSNLQTNSAELASTVTAAFAVDTAEDGTIQGSSISVSDNVQMASAVANTAQSALSLGGADGAEAASVAASSELTSVQRSNDFVTAESTMQASAAASIDRSTLAIDGNRNTALAVGNDAMNATSVRATNATTTSSSDANASLTGALFTSTADHLASSNQEGSAPVSATAQSSIFNQDLLADGTAGIFGSSISMSGNATVAEASMNRATNSLSLDAGADLGATGGVMNMQTASASVTASATSDVTLGLTGNDGFTTVSGSNLAIEGNSTTALARGNFASNALNAAAGAGYAPQVAGSSSIHSGAGQTVTASYAVLNSQENTGAVSASSVGTTYRVTPAGASLSDAMATGSSLTVGGNLVAAEAYGNQASNTVRMAGLNTTMPTAAVGNSQRNTATVSSSVTGASVGISGTGTAGTSGMGVSGNTISASATGNSVTNSIKGN